MPSLKMGFVAGSGFTPLISGNPYSGRMVPQGGIQLVAHPSNSGNIYVSLSGGFPVTGQVGLLVGSGGPTINSGLATDGLPVAPGASYFVPKLGIPNTGSYSGKFTLCVGCDVAGSGRDFIHYEMY